MDRQRGLRLLHQNVRGFLCNYISLEVLLNIELPDIVCFSEHFLRNNEIGMAAFSGFTMASAYCRSSMNRGGVCLFIKESLTFKVIDVSAFCREGVCEVVAINVELKTGNLTVIGVYRPPSSDRHAFEDFFELIYDCLTKLSRRNCRSVIMGDFNVNLAESSLLGSKLLSLMGSFGLRNTVDVFTREFKGSRSIIDHVYTDIEPYSAHTFVTETGISDHKAQIIDLSVIQNPCIKTMRFKYGRVFSSSDIHIFRGLLYKESWLDVFSSECLDSKFNSFVSTLKYYMDLVFPIRKINLAKNKKSSSKISLDDNLLRLRQELLDLHGATRDLESLDPLKQFYNKSKREYRSAVSQAKSTKVLGYIDGAKSKSKAMWDIINEGRNSKCGSNKNTGWIDEIVDSCGNVVTEPIEVAEVFNSFFVNIGKKQKSKIDSSFQILTDFYVCESFFLYPTDLEEVKRVVMSLKSSKSSGMDEVSSSLLKECSDLLAVPLVHIINFSFSCGLFPSKLKIAIVKPVHKKSSKQACDNYRPISILSTFSKVFEKIVVNRLLLFFDKYNVLFSNQFGFQKNKSTLNAMFCFINKIVEALDKKQCALGLFVDLSKAFDLVDHSLLLNKLHTMGIRGQAHKWFTSYLTGRTQRVEVNFVDSFGFLRKQHSSDLKVEIGVPQGSVLGPILFLCFINDVKQCINKAHLCLFADDISLLVTASNRLDLEIVSFMESNALLQWLLHNDLIVNTDKTHLIDFKIKHCLSNDVQIMLGESVISSIDSVDFLGLSVDCCLKFDNHVCKITSRLSSCLFALRKLSQFTNSHVLLTLYYGCFYPLLVYAVPIWGSENCRTNYIFRLQKKALRTIFSLKRKQSCKDVFRENSILTFPCLYIFESVMFLRKNMDLFSCSNTFSDHTLRPRHNISVPRHSTSFFEKNIKFECIKLFNSLPACLKMDMPINVFRKRLKTFLLERSFYSVHELTNN